MLICSYVDFPIFSKLSEIVLLYLSFTFDTVFSLYLQVFPDFFIPGEILVFLSGEIE